MHADGSIATDKGNPNTAVFEEPLAAVSSGPSSLTLFQPQGCFFGITEAERNSSLHLLRVVRIFLPASSYDEQAAWSPKTSFTRR